MAHLSRCKTLGAALLIACGLVVVPSPVGTAAAGGVSWPLASHFFMPSIAFSPDGRYLALGGSVGPAAEYCPQPACTGRLHVWDLRTGQRAFATDLTDDVL